MDNPIVVEQVFETSDNVWNAITKIDQMKKARVKKILDDLVRENKIYLNKDLLFLDSSSYIFIILKFCEQC